MVQYLNRICSKLWAKSSSKLSVQWNRQRVKVKTSFFYKVISILIPPLVTVYSHVHAPADIACIVFWGLRNNYLLIIIKIMLKIEILNCLVNINSLKTTRLVFILWSHPLQMYTTGPYFNMNFCHNQGRWKGKTSEWAKMGV